jgi:hypothetical protein
MASLKQPQPLLVQNGISRGNNVKRSADCFLEGRKIQIESTYSVAISGMEK